MSDQTRPRRNPFSEQGVSKYPPVAPLVGQLEVYQRIEDMVEAMHDERGSCFRAIFGDWGIGKTRLAHELVAEVCGQSKGWIIRGSDGRVRKTYLLGSLEDSGILPVFTTFTDVLKTPEEGIDLRTALPKAACVALVRLAEPEGKEYQVRMAYELQRVIRDINPDFNFQELSYIARDPNLPLDERANQAFAYLQENTAFNGQPVVQKLLVIIDEVETASEFTPANTAEERRIQEYPIEALDIKTLFSAVKEEAGQATLPHISYLLLCSPGVRSISYIEASARRLKEGTLEKATGKDLAQFLKALASDGYLSDYPGDLPRAAFLAADRNFGWFSYIVYPIYRLMREGKADGGDHEVLRKVSGRIGKIFKPQLIDDLNVPGDFKEYLRRIAYHQVPATLEHLGIPDSALKDLLKYTDPYGIKVVGEVYPVRIDGDSFIRELLATGKYQEESRASTKLVGEASAPFEPRELLSSFTTFADPEGDAILIFAAPGEFANQVRFLTPDDLTDRTIGTIHTIFEKHRVKGTPTGVGPTVTFLLKFNERWAAEGVGPWLSDQRWEDLEKKIKELSITHRRQRICQGVAKTLYDTMPRTRKVKGVKNPYVALKLSEGDNLSVTRASALVILYAPDVSTAIGDLSTINKSLRAPVLLILPNDSQLHQWPRELAATHNQHLGVLAVPRVIDVAGREHEFLLRYAYRDEDDGFPASDVRDRGREQRREYEREWRRAIEDWFAEIEEEGYLLRPITDQMKTYNQFREAYPHLAAGKNKDQIAAMENGNAMRRAIDNILMQMASGNTLKLLADNQGTLYFPNVFARILDQLGIPRKVADLADELFYQRAVGAGFSAPRSVTVVVERTLGLLEELGLVEQTEGNKYATVDSQRLGTLLKKAKNQLGDFGDSPSNFVKAVRELSLPFQQLAFKLCINEPQLKLLDKDLESARQKLPNLDLDSPKRVPAEQDTFLAVADRVKQLRRTAIRVYRDGDEGPPPVDPHTLSDNIDQIAQDTDYSTYSVEYRIQFLKAIAKAIDEKRDALRETVQRLQRQVLTAYSRNDAGTAFPTEPIVSILELTAQDLDEADTSLPPDLRTEDIDANLKTYMGAGELAKAFQRLSLYTEWLSETDPTSLWNRFVHAYNRWQDVGHDTTELERIWNQVAEYFEGDPDKRRWVSEALEDRQSEVRERVANFAHHFATDYQKSRIGDLEAEVEATEEEVQAVTAEARETLEKGEREIREEIASTALAALTRLAERLGQPAWVNEDIVWREPRHIDQHSKVAELGGRAKERGAKLLDDENWFAWYVDIYQDVMAEEPSSKLVEKHEMKILETLRDKGAIDLEMQVTIGV